MSPAASMGSTDSSGSGQLGQSPENTNVARSNSVAEKVLSCVPSLTGIVTLGLESKHTKANNIDGHGNLVPAFESNGASNSRLRYC